MNKQEIARQELSKFIKATRLKHGISQDEIEAKTRIPKEVIQSWEEGNETPRGFQFMTWLQIFGPEYFLQASLLFTNLMIGTTIKNTIKD